jgi:hypothetical protein
MMPEGQTNACGGTRDITRLPFAPDSIWNTPIGSNAVYAKAYINPMPNPDELVTINGQLMFEAPNKGGPQPLGNIDMLGLNPVILQMDSTQPLTDVKYNGNGPRGYGTDDTCVAEQAQTNFQVPWPPQYFIPTHAISQSDGFTGVLSPDRSMMTTFSYITRCQAQGYITTTDNIPNHDNLCGDGQYGTHGASGLNAIGGLLRTGELTPTLGAPKHALGINLREYWMRHITDPDGDGRSYTEERVWPARLGNGEFSGEYSLYGVGNAHGYDTPVRQGSLLAIPPNIDINNMGLLTEPGKMLAWTLQNYGGYVADTGGGSFMLYGEAGPDKYQENQMGFEKAFGDAWHMPFRAVVDWMHARGGSYPFADDINTIARALYVVTNNGPTSVGGGGTPRVPLTPR